MEHTTVTRLARIVSDMNNDYYSTSDLALASYLTLYFPIDSFDKKDPNRVIFYFKRTETFEKLVEAYWRKKVQVNPQDFFTAIKNLKTRLYQDY